MGSPRLWVGVTWLSICLPGDPPRVGTLTVPSGGVCLCLCVYVGEEGRGRLGRAASRAGNWKHFM